MRKDTAVYNLMRRLYWCYHKQWSKQVLRKMERQRRRELCSPRGKKVYMIGTPSHENLGDSAIALAQRRFLEAQGWEPERIKEIPDTEYQRNWETIRSWIPKDALIAHLGGGHMGNQWPGEEELHRRQILDLPENPAVIFPQTVFYTPDEEGQAEAKASAAVYNGKAKLTMAARERRSYEIMKGLYPGAKVLLTPDIVLSSSMEAFGAKPQKREGVLLCLRSDSERVLEDKDHTALRHLLEKRGLSFGLTDMYCKGHVHGENREALVRGKLEELASSRLVITDRLHGMVFCALTGTPCIALSNHNHKVRGTYEWISYLPYIRYVESAEEADAHIDQLLDMENCAFDNTPLKPHYAPLAQAVRKDCL